MANNLEHLNLTLRNASLFSSSPASPPASGGDAAAEGRSWTDVDVSLIDPFPHHPFHVRDDADMDALVESIRQVGVRTPLLLRGEASGRYGLVSGHRRLHAARRLGLKTVPAIVADLSDDEATIVMVDSNLSRSTILPSEKAKAYAMRLKAAGHRGVRGGGATSRARVAADMGESESTVARFARLAALPDPLLRMVDEGRIPVRAAGRLTRLDPGSLDAAADAMTRDPDMRLTMAATERLLAAADAAPLDVPRVIGLMAAPSDPSPRLLRVPASWLPDGVDDGDMLEWIHEAVRRRIAQDTDGEGSGES